MKRPSKTVTAVVALTSATTIVHAPGAGATPFPGNSVGKVADNSQHTICRSDLVQVMSDAVAWARSKIDATDMSADIFSCTGETDSVNYDQDYTTYGGESWHGSGGSTVGLNICVSQSKSTCDQSEDRYDLSFVPSAGLVAQRHLALHEIGHSIGFGHDTGSSQVMTSGNFSLTDYSSHEKGHINDQW